MGFSNINAVVPTAEQSVVQITGVAGGNVLVDIIAGTVDVTGSTVTVSSVSSTVTIAGAVTITSGSVAVSAVSGTVTIAGAVTITSGTVAVSAVSGTVTISGAVTITSGSVAVSAVSGTVTIAGAVTITSGTVAVSAVSGTVTISGAVTITSGSVTISSGSVAVTSVAGTVTIAGAVTITSGSVAVSAVSGTVTIAGAVTITSGTVAVSAVSGTVTISGAVTITSGSVAVSAVSGTVTIAGAVTISSGSVTITSGSLTVTSGTVTVKNVGGTSLATTPTLTQQASVNKTFANGSAQQTLSVAINSSDRVMAILFEFVSFSGTGGSLVNGVMQVQVAGGTTVLLYTNPDDIPSVAVPFLVAPNAVQSTPLIVPCWGTTEATMFLTMTLTAPGWATFSAVYKVIVLTAPDPGMLGSSIAPISIQGTPSVPVSVVPMGGFTKNALTSGSALSIATGFSIRVHSITGLFSGAANLDVVDGTSGLRVFSVALATGRQTVFLEGMLFTTSLTATSSVSVTNFNISYDVIKTPTVV